MNTNSDEDNNATDRSISERLASLRSIKTETAAFDAKFKSICPPPPSEDERRSTFLLSAFLNHWKAAAAVVLVGVALAIAYLAFASQPVMASSARMAQVYQDVVSGKGHARSVRTIEEARTVLNQEWADSPVALSGENDMQVMSCCVHEVGRKRMACVTFTVDNSPVTLAMADAKDIRTPGGDARLVEGYIVQSENGINMAMAQRDGVWICVMGKLPIDRIIQIAQSMR